MITDGGDQGSRVKLEQAIKAALIADTIVYSIYYADPMYHGGGFGSFGGMDDRDLRRLSEETGGRVGELAQRESRGVNMPHGAE